MILFVKDGREDAGKADQKHKYTIIAITISSILLTIAVITLVVFFLNKKYGFFKKAKVNVA